MKERNKSFTAEIDAAIRAAETDKPENERLCYDPYAISFLGTTIKFIGMVPPFRKLALWYLEKKHPFIIDCISARTRYIDEYINERIEDDIQQLIILGAGYDSRAYRIEKLKGKVKVFEVDHPATQKLKKEKVRKMLDNHVHRVPVVSDDVPVGMVSRYDLLKLVVQKFQGVEE